MTQQTTCNEAAHGTPEQRYLYWHNRFNTESKLGNNRLAGEAYTKMRRALHAIMNAGKSQEQLDREVAEHLAIANGDLDAATEVYGV